MHEIEHRGFGTAANFSINEKRHDHLIIGPVRKKGMQMKKIAKENLKLLNRLQDIKSSYDIGRMEDARLKQEHMLNNLCEYPHIFKD